LDATFTSPAFIGGLYGDDLHTLDPPYIPKLNEFYGRNVHFEYNKLRIEPERIGLIIDANDSDAFVRALPVADLMERVFTLAGFNARPSSAGLITRQLITQLGGLRDGAVFKIPGARRLLRTLARLTRFPSMQPFASSAERMKTTQPPSSKTSRTSLSRRGLSTQS
jgi:hypothetical protein